MKIHGTDPEDVISSLMSLGFSRNEAIQLILAIGLREMAPGDWGEPGNEELQIDLREIDPHHLIEISAYEVAYRHIHGVEEKAFYIGNERDLSTILGYAITRGVERMKNLLEDVDDIGLIERLLDYWP